MSDAAAKEKEHRAAVHAYTWAGYLGLLGCVAAVVGDVVTVGLRDGMSLMAHSISHTAAGEHSLIVDTGLCIFAAGILAIAWSLHHWQLGGRYYRAGTIALGLCAISIFFLAVWNGYDPAAADDLGLHMWLVYAMSALFPLSALLLAGGFSEVHRNWKRFSLAGIALWVLAGPLYYVMPESVKGLFERVVMSVIVIWVAGISLLLIQHGRKVAARTRP
jgi:hypothetical protein